MSWEQILPYQHFWNAHMLNGLWHYVKWFLFLGGPLFFIVFALYVAEDLTTTIRDAIFPEKKKAKDDDDVEIYKY